MERFYQFIEQLAEWFMQLFFDPAYHPVATDQGPQQTIRNKQQIVVDWWAKQKKYLQGLLNPVSRSLNNIKRFQVTDSLFAIVHSHSSDFQHLRKGVQLIQ